MFNIEKNRENNFGQGKRNRLQRNIRKKINLIKHKINKSNTSEYNLYLLNKIIKLKEKVNFISLKPKQKNRLKEIRRLDLRLAEYLTKINSLDKSVNEENKNILKIKTKINKLIKRKNVLNNDYSAKSHTKKNASAIRMEFRKTTFSDDIII